MSQKCDLAIEGSGESKDLFKVTHNRTESKQEMTKIILYDRYMRKNYVFSPIISSDLKISLPNNFYICIVYNLFEFGLVGTKDLILSFSLIIFINSCP